MIAPVFDPFGASVRGMNGVSLRGLGLLLVVTGCSVAPASGLGDSFASDPSDDADDDNDDDGSSDDAESEGSSTAVPADPEEDDGSTSSEEGTTGGPFQPPPDSDTQTSGEAEGETSSSSTSPEGSTGDTESAADTCPSTSLGGLGGFPHMDSLAGRADTLSGSCGGNGGEVTVGFTAPERGRYTFSTEGSGFDTVLYVLDGSSCGGAELGCNDDGAPEATSALSIILEEDQSVVLVVDAYSAGDSGNVTLDVAAALGDCGASDLGSDLPVAITGTTSGVGALEGTCGGDTASDAVFEWTAPSAGTYDITTAGSDFDTVLYVVAGGCIGDELACNDDSGGLQSAVSVTLAAGQTIAIVVDGYDTDESGAFDLSIAAG